MNFLIFPRIYANPHLLRTILERDSMSIFPNCVKNVRVQALSDSVKFSRRLISCNFSEKIQNCAKCKYTEGPDSIV